VVFKPGAAVFRRFFHKRRQYLHADMNRRFVGRKRLRRVRLGRPLNLNKTYW